MNIQASIAKIGSVGKLFTGLVLILLFVGWVVPFLNQKRPIQLIEFVTENEIDAGSLFYTDSPEAMDAIYQLSKR